MLQRQPFSCHSNKNPNSVFFIEISVKLEEVFIHLCAFIRGLRATAGLIFVVYSPYALTTEVSSMGRGQSHSLLCDAPFTKMTLPIEPLQ